MELKVVGFTGSRYGMSLYQLHKVIWHLERLQKERFAEFHHGDCIGSDRQAQHIARELGYRIVSHPPVNRKNRAFTKPDVEMPERPYLIRNHNIVDRSDVVIATPSTFHEVPSSGTWSTIRYAREQSKTLLVFYPRET